jgi:hypothetical protein
MGEPTDQHDVGLPVLLGKTPSKLFLMHQGAA